MATITTQRRTKQTSRTSNKTERSEKNDMSAIQTTTSHPSSDLPSTNMLNGISVADLNQVPQTLAEAPEQGILSFETRTSWLGGVRSRSEVTGFEAGGERFERHHTIFSDEPPQIFGDDTAPNPQELLLSGIGACLSASYAMQATMAGITLHSLEIEVRGTLDLRGPLGLADVPRGYPEVGFRVFIDAEGTPEQIQALHEQAMLASPNLYHLTNAISAQVELVIKS